MTKVEKQTEQICKALTDMPGDLLLEALMLYAMDPTFEREAICRAQTRLRRLQEDQTPS